MSLSDLNGFGGLSGVATLSKGGGGIFSKTDAILGAGGIDYAFFDSALMSSLFQDAFGTTPVTALGQPVGRQDVRKKAPHYASQTVNNSRPMLQADGLKFDGGDDSQLSDWFAQAGANCIIVQVTVPATLLIYQVIAGSSGAGAERWFMGIDAATGRLACGVGNNSIGVVTGTSDLRGQTVIVGLVCDGTNVRLYVQSQQEYVAAQSGAPTTAFPLRLGCNNATGGATQFFGGSIRRAALGNVAPTLDQFQQIRAEWLAAA